MLIAKTILSIGNRILNKNVENPPHGIQIQGIESYKQKYHSVNKYLLNATVIPHYFHVS